MKAQRIERRQVCLLSPKYPFIVSDVLPAGLLEPLAALAVNLGLFLDWAPHHHQRLQRLLEL